MEFGQLSDRGRDVVMSLLVQKSLTGKGISYNVATIRGDEDETAYIYSVLSRLVERGWLDEQKHPTDERVSVYQLRQEGRRAVDEYYRRFREVEPVEIESKRECGPSSADGRETLADKLLACDLEEAEKI